MMSQSSPTAQLLFLLLTLSLTEVREWELTGQYWDLFWTLVSEVFEFSLGKQ